jgi:UDP-glucose 4-epimerase
MGLLIKWPLTSKIRIMKILVTGGTGYIGSHTVVELINCGHDVVIVDNLSNSQADVVDRIKAITGVEPEFIEADLRDETTMAKIFTNNDFEAVVHFAGLKSVNESITKPLEYYDNNINATLKLLKVMAEYGVNKILFSSSATVYGEPGTAEFYEDLPTGQKILSPYGKTKYIIEEILKDVASAQPDFRAVILRYFNPVGAHESGLIGENPRGVPNNLLPFVAQVAAGKRKKLQIFGGDYDTPDGTCVRDYIHVVDLAKGHTAALNALRKNLAIYNLGSGHGSSVLDVVKAFEEASSQDIPYEITKHRAGDLPECFANVERAAKELNWRAEKTLQDACRDAWRFQQKSKDVS